MDSKKDMSLKSDSGYCMPFEERNKDVEATLMYGKQRHPQTGLMFFHHGIDFNAKYYLLSALATGEVTGLGNEEIHGTYQIIRYGDYEVTYSHLSNILANYGQTVKAGQVVSISGNMLHMEVKYKGEEINPIDFITMLYSNVKAMEKLGKPGMPEFVTIDIDIHSMYDNKQKEIEDLMLRFLPTYMYDMQQGLYKVPVHTEQSLRNIFTISAIKNYFYETIPSMANPLGMGKKSSPIIEKVQNLLIGDFLNYLALRHNIFLSDLTPDEKKKLKTVHFPPAE